MLDQILKYVSLITVAGAAISFMIGLIKYIDQRNREERTKRFQLYHDLMRRVSARRERFDDASLPLTQQVAAIYELQHFKEYAYASVPILEDFRAFLNSKTEVSPALLLKAIYETIKPLKT